MLPLALLGILRLSQTLSVGTSAPYILLSLVSEFLSIYAFHQSFQARLSNDNIIFLYLGWHQMFKSLVFPRTKELGLFSVCAYQLPAKAKTCHHPVHKKSHTGWWVFVDEMPSVPWVSCMDLQARYCQLFVDRLLDRYCYVLSCIYIPLMPFKSPILNFPKQSLAPSNSPLQYSGQDKR